MVHWMILIIWNKLSNPMTETSWSLPERPIGGGNPQKKKVTNWHVYFLGPFNNTISKIPFQRMILPLAPRKCQSMTFVSSQVSVMLPFCDFEGPVMLTFSKIVGHIPDNLPLWSIPMNRMNLESVAKGCKVTI